MLVETSQESVYSKDLGRTVATGSPLLRLKLQIQQLDQLRSNLHSSCIELFLLLLKNRVTNTDWEICRETFSATSKCRAASRYSTLDVATTVVANRKPLAEALTAS